MACDMLYLSAMWMYLEKAAKLLSGSVSLYMYGKLCKHKSKSMGLEPTTLRSEV